VDEAALQAIAAEGASVIVVDSDYDQALHRAAEYAKDRGEAELVQDTSWQGYEQIPQWIVDGYSTPKSTSKSPRWTNPGRMQCSCRSGRLTRQAAVTHHRSNARTNSKQR